MKKISIIVLIITIILTAFSFSSCYRTGSLDASGHYEAYAVLRFACPLFVGGTDSFDDVKLLEEDSYGRGLYAYRYNSAYSFLVICQKYDKKSSNDIMVYWYDCCWLAKKPIIASDRANYADYSVNEIKSLKDINDWDKPYDDTKLNKAEYQSYSKNKQKFNDLKAEKEKIDSLCIEKYGLMSEQHLSCVLNIIYKDNMAYTIAYTKEGTLFVCYDPSSETLIRDEEYKGDLLDCRDSFYSFVNSSR